MADVEVTIEPPPAIEVTLETGQGPAGPQGIQGEAGPQGPQGDPATNLVPSVFGRTGNVVATLGDYTSSLISNASSVVGSTVSAALDTLLGLYTALLATVTALGITVAAKIGFSDLVAANLTALGLVNGPEGAVLWVKTLRDQFVATNLASPRTVDSIEVVTHPAGGNWRWERRSVRHPSWGVQTEWFIDPVAGSDEASGLTGAAIKTWSELVRRVGVQHVVKVQMVVTIMGNLPATDPMVGEWRVVNGGRVNVTGVATQVFSGTISARQSLNTTTNLECQVTSSWTVATHLNRLVLNSTRTLSAWVAKDLGGGNARVSPWMQYSETNGSVGPATGNSEPGDTIAVYTLPTVACMQFEVRGTAGASSPCVFSRLDFTASGGTQRFFAANAQPQFVNCRFSGNTRFGAGLSIFTNCWFGADGAYAIDYSAYLRICGGLMTVAWGTSISRPGANTFELRNSVLFQGVAFASSGASYVNIQAADFRDVTGNPVTIQHGSFLAVNGPLTGTANTGVSIVLAPGSRGTYVPSSLVIVSSAGDTQIGGAARTWAQLPYVESNNGSALVAA